MRFRAELAVEQLELLCSLIGPISRLAQQCVVHIDEDNMRLSTQDAVEGISCFCELTVKQGSGIFLNHKIESKSDNQIVFEIDLLQWRTAIQSISKSDEGRRSRFDGNNDVNERRTRYFSSNMTIMKLAKRGGIPCLCVDGMAGSVEVYHAIPIRVMRVADMQQHLPPQINMPDVQLEMKNGKPLRTVVERLKSIAPQVYIQGSMDGNLVLRVDADASSIQTFFSNLQPRFEDAKSSSPDTKCTLKVDTKKLSQSLLWQQSNLSASSASLCMVENEMLVLHVLLDPASIGFFTYYVPVHFLSSSELQ